MKKTFTILHMNDLHSAFIGLGPAADYAPFTLNDDETRGGYARQATLIAQRKRARQARRGACGHPSPQHGTTDGAEGHGGPVQRCSSMSVLMYESSAGAYWISSRMRGGGKRSRNNRGSRRACSRSSGSSRLQYKHIGN